MLNIKLIVSYLEMVCNVKTFIDIKKAQGAGCRVQMEACALSLMNEDLSG